MMERDDEHFDLDDDFVPETDEEQDFDRFIDRDKRSRATAAAAIKKGKAAWSKLEDVLAERRLKKELEDFEEDL